MRWRKEREMDRSWVSRCRRGIGLYKKRMRSADPAKIGAEDVEKRTSVSRNESPRGNPVILIIPRPG